MHHLFLRARWPALLLAAAVIAACGDRTKLDATETLPVDELYAEGHQALEHGNYERAVKYLRRLVARFPFGGYTAQAELETAYAQYKANQPEDALSTVNRFIKTYPTYKQVDYAYYLRGLINFERDSGLLERYVRQDSTRRDPAFAKQSFQDLNELLQRFPNSEYSADARQRMIHLRNGLAQTELNVAEFYFRRKAYVAAQSRAKYILETYQQTPQAAEALAILTESYRRLGQKELAADSLRVLKQNFPDHPYLQGEWPSKGNRWWQLVPFIGDRKAG